MRRIQTSPFPILALLTILLSGPSLSPDALAGSGSDTDADERATVVRVGVYKSRAVALAYGQSELNLGRVRELKEKHRQAKKDGDEATVAECETLGPRWQDLLHRQVFGDAPIPDILAILEPQLPELMKTSEVDLITTGIVTARDGVEVVDLTLEMMALLGADEQALEMASGLEDAPPIPWYEFPLEHE